MANSQRIVITSRSFGCNKGFGVAISGEEKNAWPGHNVIARHNRSGGVYLRLVGGQAPMLRIGSRQGSLK